MANELAGTPLAERIELWQAGADEALLGIEEVAATACHEIGFAGISSLLSACRSASTPVARRSLFGALARSIRPCKASAALPFPGDVVDAFMDICAPILTSCSRFLMAFKAMSTSNQAASYTLPFDLVLSAAHICDAALALLEADAQKPACFQQLMPAIKLIVDSDTVEVGNTSFTLIATALRRRAIDLSGKLAPSGSEVAPTSSEVLSRFQVGDQVKLLEGDFVTLARLVLTEGSQAVVLSDMSNEYMRVEVEQLRDPTLTILGNDGQVGQDYYFDVLGLPPTATGAEVRRAFHQLAKQHHPDRGGDTAEFQRINQAFAFLSVACPNVSVPERSAEYDSGMQSSGVTSMPRQEHSECSPAPAAKVLTGRLKKKPAAAAEPYCSTPPPTSKKAAKAKSKREILVTPEKTEQKPKRPRTSKSKASGQTAKDLKARLASNSELTTNGIMQLIWRFAFGKPEVR